jgi:hypothetical protein
MLPTIYTGNGGFSIFIHTAGVAVFGALGYGTLICCALGRFKKNRDKKLDFLFFFADRPFRRRSRVRADGL